MLSVRALELLRASFLEVALASARGPRLDHQTTSASPPQEVTRWTDAALTAAMERRWSLTSTWAVEVGGCVLGSLEGVGPSVMPVIRVEHALGEHLLGRVTAAGLGTRAQFTQQLTTTDVAHAELAQQFGLIEIGARWRRDSTWQPFVSAGVGVLHLTATGQTRWPYVGLSDDRWSLVADLGAGMHVSFRRRFEVAVEVHAQGARPYPVIRFFDQEVAREGRPTLISSLTFLAWM